MARADTWTALALDRFAIIMGIPPAQFNQALAPDLNPVVFPLSGCSDIWYQYSWQKADRVGRDDLAQAIAEAEADIEAILGYPVAPRWITNEIHAWPRDHRPDARGGIYNPRFQRKSLLLRNGRLIETGRRATTLIGTATVAGGTLVYSDDDGDGLEETATITLATTLTDNREIKAYFAGHSAAREWEIRSPRSVTISGGNVILVFRSWQLIDPDLWEVFPASDDTPGAINISTTDNYITSIEIYREYTDNTTVSAAFYWENEPQNLIQLYCTVCSGAGCPACSLTSQNGCLHIRNVETGLAVPVPATYDSDNAAWATDAWTVCREPDQVEVWYRAGELSPAYLASNTTDPLDARLARAIAWLAVARLEHPFCSCGNIEALARDLRTDLSMTVSSSAGTISYQNSIDVLDNPFGTRRGEYQAWRIIRRLLSSPSGKAVSRVAVI